MGLLTLVTDLEAATAVRISISLQLEGVRFAWRNLVDNYMVNDLEDDNSLGGAILAHSMVRLWVSDLETGDKL